MTGGAGTGGGPPLVVVGASWGGLHALGTLVRGLPAGFPAAVAVVQHRGREGDGLLASLLQEVTPLAVGDVDDKEPIAAGHVYVAPPDYHLLVDEGHFSLATDDAVRYSRPSIDVTMVSAAEAYGPRVLAVVCTGANEDGARGARRVVDRGGAALVQDPDTAEVRTMPEAALRYLKTAPRERWDVAPLDGLAARIVAALRPAGYPGGAGAAFDVHAGVPAVAHRAVRGAA